MPSWKVAGPLPLQKMVVVITKEQLNSSKINLIVNDELPRALRQTFKSMWDNKFGPGELWDDTETVRKSFLAKEGGLTKVPTEKSYLKWDCTDLAHATIFATSLALPDSSGHLKTLNDLYVKPRRVPRECFHSSVVSPSGNEAETFALAIDQIRRLRNSVSHRDSAKMDRATFDQFIQRAKEALQALGHSSSYIEEMGNLQESEFPTSEVKKERREKNFYKVATVVLLS